MPSMRSQLRVDGQLSAFLQERRPDLFHRRYFQCFPANGPSLRAERFSETLYNYMDVSTRMSGRFWRVSTSRPEDTSKLHHWAPLDGAGPPHLA